LADFNGNLPAALQQLLDLLDAVAAPDDMVKRLQAAAGPLLLGSVKLDESQLAAFCMQHRMLQLWVKRERVDKVCGVADVLLSVLGA
jgi:hypothetical protein